MRLLSSLVNHYSDIDRPFISLVRHIETGTILFLGHVMNPVL